LGGRRAREIKAVAAGTVTDAMGFGLGGADCGFLLAISDLAASGYVPLLDEEDDVGARNLLVRRSAIFPTPCARRPKSFAMLLVHRTESGPSERGRKFMA
jgi:hypothetical protein